MIITIDGPGGTGKSTIAKKVATELGYEYFDTGAMYRAFAWKLLEDNVPVVERYKVADAVKGFLYSIKHCDTGEKRYYVCDHDVTEMIRSDKVTMIASKIAIYPEVRKAMVDLQRSLAVDCNSVFEGRDMGSYVFPQADIKIYLDASPEVRAERRYIELKCKNDTDITFEEVLEDLRNRDYQDSNRQLAPLCCPQDANVIDTSSCSIDEVVGKVLEIISKGV